MPTYRSDDLALLAPGFQERASLIVERMTNRGYSPVVFDTLRTAEEAAKNAAKKTGIKDSMHEYNVACDVICGEHGWSCSTRDPKTKQLLNDCKFFVELREVIKECGVHLGPVGDMPHFQGIPVGRQSLVRAVGKDQTPEKLAARGALCARFMLPIKPASHRSAPSSKPAPAKPAASKAAPSKPKGKR